MKPHKLVAKSKLNDPYLVILSLYLIRLASCMLASGSDDGTFSIRDLRLLKVCLLSLSLARKMWVFFLFVGVGGLGCVSYMLILLLLKVLICNLVFCLTGRRPCSGTL